jgi:hypothetical protein
LVSGTVAALLVATLAAPAALADPPAHAPAHGWRAKHQPYYVTYDRYDPRYGHDRRGGSCNGDDVGAVLGAVGGGLIGAKVAKGDNKVVGILTGAAIGGVLGHEIGRSGDPDCGRSYRDGRHAVPVRGYYPATRGYYPTPRQVYVVPARYPDRGVPYHRDARRHDDHDRHDWRDHHDRRDGHDRRDDRDWRDHRDGGGEYDRRADARR